MDKNLDPTFRKHSLNLLFQQFFFQHSTNDSTLFLMQLFFKVGKLRKTSEGSFEILSMEGNQLGEGNFDITILALPMTHDTQDMKIEGTQIQHIFPGTYHRTVATLVEG